MMNDILTTVFRRIRGRLYDRAVGMLQSGPEADDALQEAFVRLWQRRDTFAGESQAEGAAVATVRNICIDELRRRSAHPLAAEMPDMPLYDAHDDMQDVIGHVQRLIESELSLRDRSILIMRDRNGYDFDEIAEELGMTEPAVRMALSRARKTIRNIYRKQHGK
ncbi:MAG: sigma-70 family RNA polymerase sigma factor [Muribaculaceae bacterium]|nr:sigma-70 family RNA polymerase sigma factor [Muribaculaceae bacterium]